ncbi:ATP-grasp domain-containing protein [Bacillus sp. DJP31]|uniref:ATP-grasp domain-containing protein n=1 Tax=Bacillus sp. DJP31 TaxID=3409789 RepID=UPI003BB54B15
MNAFVFIETNKSGSSRDAIKAAERLGYYTILFTSRKKLLHQRIEFYDVHEMIYINTLDEEEMIARLYRLESQGKIVRGILSFVDPFVHIATKLSTRFEIEGFTASAIEIMEDKVLTRMALKDCDESLHFEIYSNEGLLETFLDNSKLELPVIVKSPISTGSKDVILAETRTELKAAILSLVNNGNNRELLLEEYIDGPQWLVETVILNGEVEIVAVIEQEVTKGERFIITGYYVIPKLEMEFLSDLKEALTSIITTLGMKKGTCHFELRQKHGHWKLIEVNPRISGGAMNSMIYHSFGINLVEETIKIYLGLPFSLERKSEKYVYTHYITSSSKGRLIKVVGKSRALSFEGIKEVYIKPRKGMFIAPPVSMGQRYGYVMASADSKAEAGILTLSAAREIKFYIEEQE